MGFVPTCRAMYKNADSPTSKYFFTHLSFKRINKYIKVEGQCKIINISPVNSRLRTSFALRWKMLKSSHLIIAIVLLATVLSVCMARNTQQRRDYETNNVENKYNLRNYAKILAAKRDPSSHSLFAWSTVL
jgi:hypothetical protein